MDKDGKAGKNYKGSVAKTISGKECQKWSEQKPQKHGFGDVGDHNFCRNPEIDLVLHSSLHDLVSKY